MPDQNCPLCGNNTEFSGEDYGRRKAFNCNNCGTFIISTLAETRLTKAPQTWKDQLSAKAKAAPDGQHLVITMPSIQKQCEDHQAINAVYEPLKV